MAYTKNFVKYYDILGWRDFSINTFKKIKEYFPEKEFTYLDMACGTGSLSKEISKNIKQSKVDAFDISPEMIESATKRSSRVNFFVADMTKFKASQKYDVISCLYDSINHINGIANWERIFKNAHFSLKTNGVFIFDFNTIKAKKNWESDWDNQYNGYLVACKNIGKKYDGKATIIISAFLKNKKLFEEEFTSYFYPSKMIKSILRESGFKIIKESDNKPKTRKFIFARKA